MTTLRRILTGTTIAVLACGMASADSIGYLSTPVTFGPQATDFAYSLSLPDFNPLSAPAGAVLTGATIFFYAQGTVTTLTLTNTSSNANTFEFIASSNVTSLSTNSANQADAFQGETLTLFDQSMTLGGTPPTTTCPTGTPSSSCNIVTFADTSNSIPAITANNLHLTPSVFFPTGTGLQGLTGVIQNITGGDLLNYIGAGSFTLGGTTKSLTTFSGGGNNVTPAINTTGQFSAEIDYTYVVPSGTPEPASMALMGGALLGLGFLGRRFRKKS